MPKYYKSCVLKAAAVVLLCVSGGFALHGEPTPSAAVEPTELAGELARQIEDVDFRSRLMLEMVDLEILHNRLESPEAIAESIPDYRRGIALGKAAAALARKGKATKATDLIASALSLRHAALPWQADAVRAEAAIGWIALNREKEAGTVIAAMSDEAALIRARSGMAVERAWRGQPFDGTAFEFAAAEEKAKPERTQAVRALLEICEIKLREAKREQERKEVAQLAEKADAILKATRAAAGEEYLDLGLLWRKLGDKRRSAECLSLVLRELSPGVQLQDWRPGYFARLLRLYAEAGEPESVARMLNAAREGTSHLHPFYQPAALCQIAEAEVATGHANAADLAWLEAARIAQENPNPDSQSVGCAQVALSLSRANRRPSAPLELSLVSQASASVKQLSRLEN